MAVLQLSYLYSKIACYSVFRCIVCMSLMFVAFIVDSEASWLLSSCYLCTYVCSAVSFIGHLWLLTDHINI